MLWRRSDQANDVKQAFGLERLRHADDGAELVAGGVIGRLGRAREKNYGNALEAFVALDDEAEVLAGHVFGFDFSDQDGRDRRLQDFEGFVCRGDNDHVVPIGLKSGAHDFGGALIGFDGKNHGVLRLGRLRGCGGRGCAGACDSRFGGGELNSDGETIAGLFGDSNDLGRLALIQSSGRG